MTVEARALPVRARVGAHATRRASLHDLTHRPAVVRHIVIAEDLPHVVGDHPRILKARAIERRVGPGLPPVVGVLVHSLGRFSAGGHLTEERAECVGPVHVLIAGVAHDSPAS